ncbi:TPA: glycosyltransferase [Clostridium perfringens]
MYTAADVFINASVEKIMGLVTIEALAYGTPTIVNNSTAIPEFFDDLCGFITNIKDVNKTIDLINSIKTKPISSINYIEKARKYKKKKKYIDYILIYMKK